MTERDETARSGDSDPAGDSRPDVIADRYETVARLGAGTFGDVVRAHDRLLDRDVALKRVRLEAFAEPGRLEEVRQRFLREAQVAARLRHPSIVTTHDILTDASGSYIVMEMVEGKTLQTLLLDRGSLSLEETAGILAPVALALDHAHGRGIVHRDVKPANVMIEPSGHVKVMDFGIAKLDTGANLTSSGLIVGTPNYMAPEQARSENVDGRADLFSLGCILYECLSGQKPFRGDTVTAILVKILTEEPPPVDFAGLGLPQALGDVLRRAMAKDPERRYRRGVELVAAVCAAGGLPPAGLAPPARLATAGSGADAEADLELLEEDGPKTVVSAGPRAAASPSRTPAAEASPWPPRKLVLATGLVVVLALGALLASGPLQQALAPPPPPAEDGSLVQREDVGVLGRLLGRRPRLFVTVPVGASVRLVLNTPLSSRTAQAGDTFAAVVASAVTVEETEAVPPGARAYGHVTHVRPADDAAGRAELALELDRVVLEDGQTVRVQASPLLFRGRSTSRKDAGVTGALAEVTSFVGGLFGGKKGGTSGGSRRGSGGAGSVVTTRGEEVDISPGTSLPFELAEPVQVIRPTRDP